MIIVMKPDASEDQVEHIIEHVKDLKLKPVPIVGTERTVVAVVGEERNSGITALESSPGVDEVLPIVAQGGAA